MDRLKTAFRTLSAAAVLAALGALAPLSLAALQAQPPPTLRI